MSASLAFLSPSIAAFPMRVADHQETAATQAAAIGAASHELRSPLAVILGYAYTLRERDAWDTDHRRELVEVIIASAEKLSFLVDDLLDVARLDRGALRLEREPVRIDRLVQRVIAQRRPLLPERSLHVILEGAVPLVEADPFRIEQVITNLVDNAIRYSRADSAIVVRIVSDVGVRVSVSDEGDGIPTRELPRIFDPFFRGSSAQQRARGGAGLGLYLCRQIIAAHGGEIWAESASGTGSTFSFTLPAVDEISKPDPATRDRN